MTRPRPATTDPLSAPRPSYWVVMLDHGKRGREAVIDPEITRREVVSRILSGEYPSDQISFIHFIGAGEVMDLTAEVLAEAQTEMAAQIVPVFPSPVDRQEWAWDHARDHEKNWIGV